MEVTNETSFQLIALGWDVNLGDGEETSIKPGETIKVDGPYLGEMGGGSCHIHISGKIICHEGDDDTDHGRFHISRGNPLIVREEDGNNRVTIRHFEDERP